MIKYRPNCRACALSKGNPKARLRIYNAKYKREDGDESLKTIATEFGIPFQRLYNHANKHMSEALQQGTTKEIHVAKKTAEFKANAQKELELAIDLDTAGALEGRPEQIIALDEYIAQGATEIAKGNLKLTANAFLAAVKIKNDWEAKQTTNKIELMKTIQAFRSGKQKEVTENDRTPREVTGSIDSGADKSRSVHFRLAGYANAQGADPVPS